MSDQHIERMRKEHAELCDRLSKLNAFITTDTFGTLAIDEQNRMKRQLVAMREYADMLEARLTAVEEFRAA